MADLALPASNTLYFVATLSKIDLLANVKSCCDSDGSSK